MAAANAATERNFCNVRMASLPPYLSIRQFEKDVYRGRQIHRMSVLHCRTKANLTCCRHGRLIQTISQSPDDTLDLHLARCRKCNLDQDFAFDALLSRQVGVNRLGLEKNFDRLSFGGARRWVVSLRYFRNRMLVG